MASRKELESNPIHGTSFPESNGGNIDFTQAILDNGHRTLRTKVVLVAPAGMISMAMSNQSLLDGAPRINIHIRLRAINAIRCKR